MNEQLALVLRGLAAIVWTALLVIHVRRKPARRSSDLQVKVAYLAVVGAAWAFVFGAFVNLRVFSLDTGTLIYTAVAAGLFLVGLALLSLKDEL